MGKMKGELAVVCQCGANKKSMVFPAHAANVLQGTGWDTHTHTWGGHCQNVPLIDRLIFPLDVIHYPQSTNTPGLHNDTQQVEINVFVKDESKECEFKQQHHLNW